MSLNFATLQHTLALSDFSKRKTWRKKVASSSLPTLQPSLVTEWFIHDSSFRVLRCFKDVVVAIIVHVHCMPCSKFVQNRLSFHNLIVALHCACACAKCGTSLCASQLKEQSEMKPEEKWTELLAADYFLLCFCSSIVSSWLFLLCFCSSIVSSWYIRINVWNLSIVKQYSMPH